jgi:hypothetical protein
VRNRAQIQPPLAAQRVSNHPRPCMVYAYRALRPVSMHRCIPAPFGGPDPATRSSARRVDAYQGSVTIPSSASMIDATSVAVQSLTTSP